MHGIFYMEKHSVLDVANVIRLRDDDVIKLKTNPRYWRFERGIHRSPVNSPHKVQWRGALMFSLICAWINGWINNHEAGDLRCHPAHYDVIVMNRAARQAIKLLLTACLDAPHDRHSCLFIYKDARLLHNDIMAWKCFPCVWPSVMYQWIPITNGQWCVNSMVPLLLAKTSCSETFGWLAIWDTLALRRRDCNDIIHSILD